MVPSNDKSWQSHLYRALAYLISHSSHLCSSSEFLPNASSLGSAILTVLNRSLPIIIQSLTMDPFISDQKVYSDQPFTDLMLVKGKKIGFRDYQLTGHSQS